jgi:hypothetical protein
VSESEISSAIGAVALAGIAAALGLGAHASAAGDAWTVSPGERTNVLIELTGGLRAAIA